MESTKCATGRDSEIGARKREQLRNDGGDYDMMKGVYDDEGASMI